MIQRGVLHSTERYSLLSWMTGYIWHLSSTWNGKTVSRIPGCCWGSNFVLKGGWNLHQGFWESDMLGLSKVEPSTLGIETRSFTWQSSILVTLLWRIETWFHHSSLFKSTNCPTIPVPYLRHWLRDSIHMYYTQTKGFPRYKVCECIWF